MKVQPLSGAGINFPQEQTENTWIPKLQFRTTQVIKYFFLKMKENQEQHNSKH